MTEGKDAGTMFYEVMREYNQRYPKTITKTRSGEIIEIDRDYDSALGAMLPGAIENNKDNAYITRVKKRKGEN